MAITINNLQTAYSSSDSTTYTLSSYAVTSGSDRLLVVRFSGQQGSTSDFTLSATFNSVSMTEATTGTVTAGSQRWRGSIFYLVAPTETTADIVVTSTGTLQGGLIAAVTLLDVDQSDPLGEVVGASISGATATFSIASGLTTGSLILAAVGGNSSGPPTHTWTDATEEFDLNYGSNSSSEHAGSGAYLFTTGSSASWECVRSSTSRQSMVAAEFLEATGGGGGSARAKMRKLRQGVALGVRMGF